MNDFERDLKRMRYKRQLLIDGEDVTPGDWDALAAEYSQLDFMANASSCRVRAKQMREMAVGDAP